MASNEARLDSEAVDSSNLSISLGFEQPHFAPRATNYLTLLTTDNHVPFELLVTGLIIFHSSIFSVKGYVEDEHLVVPDVVNMSTGIWGFRVRQCSGPIQ